MSRTDDHNSPTAFTVDIAKQAGLIVGTDYEPGKVFPDDPHQFTAKILTNPILSGHDIIDITIRVIDRVGFYTQHGAQRWTYIAIPKWLWDIQTPGDKRDIIGGMYHRETGTAMIHLFPNYEHCKF